MKIFVINLPGHLERRAKSKAQLDDLGVSFEFFDAVRGDTALEDFFEGYDEYRFLLSTGRTVTLGEIGCYASHLSLWKKCIELDQSIMIMEDDFLLDARFADAVPIVAEYVDELGFIRLQSETRGKKRLVMQLGEFRLWRYTRFPHSTLCYAISPSVAQTFVSISTVLVAPIDVQIKKFWEHGHLMYGLSPYTVTEGKAAFDSTIKGRQKARKSLKLKLLRPVTKLSWFLNRVKFNLTVANRQLQRAAKAHH